MEYKIVERQVIVRETWVVGIEGQVSEALNKVKTEDLDAVHLQGSDDIVWDREDEFVTTILDPTDKELADPVVIKAIRTIESNYDCQEEPAKIPKKRRKKRQSGLTQTEKSDTMSTVQLVRKLQRDKNVD